jgi:hypothetical protein
VQSAPATVVPPAARKSARTSHRISANEYRAASIAGQFSAVCRATSPPSARIFSTKRS